MIHGYHVILPCYGFWLPNDPRGSWSGFVASWEIAKFGKTTRALEQRKLSQLSPEELAQRESARTALLYPPVILNGHQALSIAHGFANQAFKSGYSIWGCSILPEHTHLVIARHHYKVEQVANLLKGAATRELVEDDRHPLGQYAKPGESPPHMWARYQWKVYLDSEEAIENAIAYVIDNPIKEGKRRQEWSWVTPFAGLETGWVTYH
jgi:REP element-mobilizing transposase RayT